MLTARIIPCLDVDAGHVVKGVKFQDLRRAGDPAERAAEYERQGADELVILDVSATHEGRGHQVDTTRKVRAVLSIPLTVGGGVRLPADAGRLLEAGADKVAINSAAVADPSVISGISKRYGAQCAVVAIDARRLRDGTWGVVVRGGRDVTDRRVVEWAREAVDRGAGELLLTSWDQDGTRAGYDLDLLRAVSAAVPVPVIASGGADGPHHMIDALRAGADAVLAASIFHDGDWTVARIKDALAEAGVEVRPV